MSYGTLYLIPTPLGENAPPEAVLPASALAIARQLQHFVVEHPKTARACLKLIGTALPLQQLSMQTLNEHTSPQDVAPLLAPLLAGHDVGLLSEAGCPAVADPGAQLVALAHQQQIPVRPLVGPSSLLLALMASGLNGQRFSFQGYLPAQAAERLQRLQQLEQHSRRQQETILFIETPYRNAAMLESLLQTLQPETRLCVATDLTLPSEQILTRRVVEWRPLDRPDLNKRPSIFLLLA